MTIGKVKTKKFRIYLPHTYIYNLPICFCILMKYTTIANPLRLKEIRNKQFFYGKELCKRKDIL